MAYSFLDLAEEVLKSVPNPMTYQQVWDSARKAGLNSKVKTKGKTPWHTMGAQLYVDVRDNPDSRFVKVGKRPARFFLKKRQDELSEALLQKIEIEEAKKPEQRLRTRNGICTHCSPTSFMRIRRFLVAAAFSLKRYFTRVPDERDTTNGSILTSLASISLSVIGSRT